MAGGFLRIVVVMIVVLFGAPAAALAQNQTPGKTPASALPVSSGDVYHGTLKVPGEVQVFRVDVQSGLQAIRVGIRHKFQLRGLGQSAERSG